MDIALVRRRGGGQVTNAKQRELSGAATGMGEELGECQGREIDVAALE